MQVFHSSFFVIFLPQSVHYRNFAMNFLFAERALHGFILKLSVQQNTSFPCFTISHLHFRPVLCDVVARAHMNDEKGHDPVNFQFYVLNLFFQEPAETLKVALCFGCSCGRELHRKALFYAHWRYLQGKGYVCNSS